MARLEDSRDGRIFLFEIINRVCFREKIRDLHLHLANGVSGGKPVEAGAGGHFLGVL